MITVQYIIRAFSVTLALLMMQGCSSMELAVDLYKKQNRVRPKVLLWRRRATRLVNPIK